MTKPPSPKADQLRALREAQFSRSPTPRAPIETVRKATAAIPAKKEKKPPKRPMGQDRAGG